MTKPKKQISFSTLGNSPKRTTPKPRPKTREPEPNPGALFSDSKAGGTFTKPRAQEPQTPLPAFSMDWFRTKLKEPKSRPRPQADRFNVAVIGRFTAWPWGQHPDEEYLAAGMEAEGAHVLRLEQEERWNPMMGIEWAVFTAHERSRAQVNVWRRSCRTLLWTLDWLPGMQGREPVIETARRVSLFISSDLHDWSANGIAHHKYLPGACEGHLPAFDPQPVRSCAFLGTIYNKRREEISALVQARGGEVLGQSGSWLYGDDLARFVQGTKVIVGDNYTNGVSGYWSTRNYVIPGAGGFLLASSVPGLEIDFTPGEHLGVYRSIEELPDALDRWIADDGGREEIRRKGFLHVRLKHAWRVRARSLLAFMGYRAPE